MNIFVLHRDPATAARDHCDRHILKMILEYGQMLSTAHRLLDGELCEETFTDEHGKSKKVRHWLLTGEACHAGLVNKGEDGYRIEMIVENSKCYKVAHANHPCSVWVRESRDNYAWMFAMFLTCLAEYTRRYGKSHSAEKLLTKLCMSPTNISHGRQTPFVQAMPEEYKHDDAVEAYRNFYAGSKKRFARWTNTPVPDWFINRLEGQDVSIFSRTR
jgi:hypothetical protein